MNRRILAVGAVVLVIAGVLMMGSLFIVDQTEEALVLQFGEARRVIREPGLEIKRPFIENVIFYDNRLLDFDISLKINSAQFILNSSVQLKQLTGSGNRLF